MANDFQFLMLGAMYENGGNTTHRMLDGHPELFVYPFESQVGTKFVNDHFSTMFPNKYRWPTFALDATPYQDYKAIIDEEGKVRSRTPKVSKFRHWPMEMDDDQRCELYLKHIERLGRSRANNMEAFFRATFEAWKDYKTSGRNRVYVGYSPIIGVDGDKILDDMPGAHVLHVVRNPWAAFADTKKRPVPMSLHHYMLGWVTNQHHALLFQERYPDRFHIVRTEDVMADPQQALTPVCDALGIKADELIPQPTWNSEVLENIQPWGTVNKAATDVNIATARELSQEEIEEIDRYTRQFQEMFEYDKFLRDSLQGSLV